MGTWKLEAFKMFIYMAFPVGVFYYFNQPKYFEEWLVKIKREVYPHENQNHKQELEDFIKEYREAKDKERLRQLEETTSQNK